MCPGNEEGKRRSRLEHRGAIVAVAHALEYAIYNVLHYRRPYCEAGAPAALDRDQTARLIRHHRRRLKQLAAWLPKAPPPDYSYTLKRLEGNLDDVFRATATTGSGGP